MTGDAHTDVAIVGGGPAGLTAAIALRESGVGSVTVIEREAEAGGIPRHSDHTGYGLRDLRTVTTGPKYAQRLVGDALAAGVELRTSTMVTGWHGDLSLDITSPRGRQVVEARAIVLATGARERPRPARLIPGDRPAGVLTTGQLQNLVHLHHRGVGQRAVVVGAELVSWSAVMTLREAGCSTALMTTTFDRPEAYAAFTIPGRLALRVPVARRTRVVRVVGRDRVSAVEVEHLDTGERRLVPCDTIVFTGDWIPDHELARLRGIEIDPGHRGPLVDTALRTSAPGIFAVGNVLHPVDTADVAALDGRHVAGHVARFLQGGDAPGSGVRLRVESPFVWAAPGILRPTDGAPARNRIIAWADEFHAAPRVVVRQGSRTLSRRRLPWPLSPGRAFRVPWSLVSAFDRHGDDVVITLG